jgi:hypothetical protein
MTSTSVLLLSAEASVTAQSTRPLAELLSDPASFAAVDNSGSTTGLRLQVAMHFVQRLGVSLVSLWNSSSSPALPLNNINWYSTGGTAPESVFAPVSRLPANPSCFVFMTDGEVPNTANLAAYAFTTAHLPSLLVIFSDDRTSDTQRVSTMNVSVLMAHFTAASTGAVLVVRGNDDIRMIAVKGTWLDAFQTPPPDLTDDLQLGQCPSITLDTIRGLPSVTLLARPRGTIPIADGRLLDLDAVLTLPLGDVRAVLALLDDNDLDNVARAFHALRQLGVWRRQLNRWLVAAIQEAENNSVQQQEQAGQFNAIGVHAMLRRLRYADQASTAAQREQLLAVVHAGAQRTAEADQEASSAGRDVRSLINRALGSVTALEQIGMSATALGRLSNRAQRAQKIDPMSLVQLDTLAIDGAPAEEDLIVGDAGPVAICLRTKDNTEENTSDFALDQGLRVGLRPSNTDVIEPTVVALAVADRIEAMERSPLTRRPLSVCLPIVDLSNDANRLAVYHRLCVVFMNGLAMPHVWLVALGAILRTIEAREWADPMTTSTGRLLSYMALQIMTHVTLAPGVRLAPSARRPTAIAEALVAAHRSDIITVHSSVVEASAILRLLHRFGGLSPVSLRQAMLARIATAVPQAHRNWLKERVADQSDVWADQGAASLGALTAAIYDTSVAAGDSARHIPIAGTGRLVDTLDTLLPVESVDAVHLFADALGLSTDDMIVPGLTLVVLGTLEYVTTASVSSSQAVQLVRVGSAAAAAEMDATTAGLAVTYDDAINAVQRRLTSNPPLNPPQKCAFK